MVSYLKEKLQAAFRWLSGVAKSFRRPKEPDSQPKDAPSTTEKQGPT